VGSRDGGLSTQPNRWVEDCVFQFDNRAQDRSRKLARARGFYAQASWGTGHSDCELSSQQMKTKFGLRQRPDFKITDWRNLGASAAPTTLLPGSAVTEPTPTEIISDSLPDDNIPF
jgi:hypothetical protein